VEPSAHATIFLPPGVAGPVEAARRRWDPDMAAQIAAHVTLVYPHEVPSPDRLVERVRTAAAAVAPFRLRLGGLACLEHPENGVYLAVEDVDGGYRALRDAVLGPPFRPAVVPPHVTLVHPRTSRRGRELWDSGADRHHEGEFTADQVAITVFDGARWITATTVVLGRAVSPAVHVDRLAGSPVEGLTALIAESERHGLRFVRRLAEDWTGGADRFDRPGEALFVARIAGEIVGVCGLNVDPYAGAPAVGRVRHLYVLSARRRLGVGRELVTAVVRAARGRFEILRLRTQSPDAARLYERLGFRRTAGVPACTHVLDLCGQDTPR
jgi:GNAT superfamily N-acetyltransferase